MGSIDAACISGFLCRLCSEMHRTVIHIYSDQGQKHGLAKKINAYLPVTITPNDPLPKTICETCMLRVEQHHELMQKMQKHRSLFMAQTAQAQIVRSENSQTTSSQTGDAPQSNSTASRATQVQQVDSTDVATNTTSTTSTDTSDDVIVADVPTNSTPTINSSENGRNRDAGNRRNRNRNRNRANISCTRISTTSNDVDMNNSNEEMSTEFPNELDTPDA